MMILKSSSVSFERPFMACKNPDCRFYQKRNGNIRFKSKEKNIFYCTGCKKSWSAHQGSFLYNLKTPTKTVLRCLHLLSLGKPMRATAREQRVTTDSIYDWMKRAFFYLPEVMRLMKEELSVPPEEVEKIRNFIKRRSASLNERSD